jgi:hypothetical protein
MAHSSVLAPQLRSQHNLHIESLPVLLAVTAAWLWNRRVHSLIISIHFTLCSNQSWPVYFTTNFAMFSLILLVWCLVSVFFCQCSFPESLARGFPYRTDTVLLCLTMSYRGLVLGLWARLWIWAEVMGRWVMFTWTCRAFAWAGEKILPVLQAWNGLERLGTSWNLFSLSFQDLVWWYEMS